MILGKMKWLVICAAVVATPACGDDGGSTTPDAMVQPDGGGPPPGPVTPALQLGSYESMDVEDYFTPSGPADFSCAGSRILPEGGEASTFTLHVQDFRDDNPVADVCVKFYADNMVPAVDTCDSDGDGLVTDADGNISVTAPVGSWYAYRVFAREGAAASQTIVGSVQVNELAPESGGTAQGTSVNQGTLDLIPTIYGFRRAAGKAIVAGIVYDCGDETVYGATVRIATEDGTYVAEGELSSDPHYRYFNGDNFPSADQTFTHADGLYAVANIDTPETGGQVIFIEVWGRTSEEAAEAELLACEQARVFADSISIVNLEPLRSDGPACPGLSR